MRALAEELQELQRVTGGPGAIVISNGYARAEPHQRREQVMPAFRDERDAVAGGDTGSGSRRRMGEGFVAKGRRRSIQK
jgi:hypothetical protein